METKQSSIDFLLTELDISKLISRENLTIAAEVVRQAKEMHKQEIEIAFDEGGEYEYHYILNSAPKVDSETYYKENFGK